jgi:hypothetical protein
MYRHHRAVRWQKLRLVQAAGLRSTGKTDSEGPEIVGPPFFKRLDKPRHFATIAINPKMG